MSIRFARLTSVSHLFTFPPEFTITINTILLNNKYFKKVLNYIYLMIYYTQILYFGGICMRIKLWILLLFISGLFYPGIIVNADERIQIDGYVKYDVSSTVSEFSENKEAATLVIDSFTSTEVNQLRLTGNILTSDHQLSINLNGLLGKSNLNVGTYSLDGEDNTSNFDILLLNIKQESLNNQSILLILKEKNTYNIYVFKFNLFDESLISINSCERELETNEQWWIGIFTPKIEVSEYKSNQIQTFAINGPLTYNLYSTYSYTYIEPVQNNKYLYQITLKLVSRLSTYENFDGYTLYVDKQYMYKNGVLLTNSDVLNLRNIRAQVAITNTLSSYVNNDSFIFYFPSYKYSQQVGGFNIKFSYALSAQKYGFTGTVVWKPYRTSVISSQHQNINGYRNFLATGNDIKLGKSIYYNGSTGSDYYGVNVSRQQGTGTNKQMYVKFTFDIFDTNTAVVINQLISQKISYQ